ncbi:MAG: HIT domain-containing protein [Candidatus Cloacimonadales bacterium]|nr:HIT domain-containing protein [Candidatus Cloacimonadales bacterium]
MCDVLYSPWRLKYILSKKDEECIFCVRPSVQNDEKHLILFRSEHSFVIMNLFPYNNGHLMAVPFRHVSRLADLNKAEIDDLFETVQLCEKVMHRTYSPDGLNIGLNLGRAAGAGIEAHLHVHIVPRWNGDVNFMTAIGATRVIPESFERAFEQLKEQFEKASAQLEEQIDKAGVEK